MDCIWAQRSSLIGCRPEISAPQGRRWLFIVPGLKRVHSNTAQWAEWADANETVRPPLLLPILHSEWPLSSPRPYKSHRGGGGLNGGEAGVWEEGGGRWSGGEKKKNRSYGQTVLFKDVTVIGPQ